MVPSSPAQRIIQGLWSALPAQFGAVVSVGVQLGPVELAQTWRPGPGTYFAELERAEPSGAGSERILLAFELPLAIVFAGQLVLTPDAEIRAQIAKDDLAPAEMDAMGECINTFAAAIGEVVHNVLAAEERWVLRKGSLTVPEHDSLAPFTVASGELELGDLAIGRLDIVVSQSLWSSADDPGERRREPSEDDARMTSGVELTAEELAAIREATQAGLAGKTLLMVPSLAQRQEWTTLLEDSGIDFEFVADPYHLLRLCRTESIDAVVIDADACPSGGLTILAMLRGRIHEPMPRIVVASRPTRTHLVSCLAAGATAYMPKPIATDALREQLDAR